MVTVSGVSAMTSHREGKGSAGKKRYKGKTVLWCFLIVIVVLYGFIIIIASLHLSSVQRNPEMVLRHKQSKLIQKNIIPSSTTTIRRTLTRKATRKKNNVVITDQDYFIIFDADIPGQGTGNLISGLLASHLLGDEFHRIVCVNPIYFSTFINAFESINILAQTKCPIILRRITEHNMTYYQQHPKHMVTVINFLGAADECDLQNIMSDPTKHIIHFIGNTYPRWPTVPDDYFLHYYQPKSILLDHLPYHEQPKIVVHLREPDDVEFDPRLGLDDVSLSALGETLPKSSNTYLVTNHVPYYDRFVQCCSWSHAQWETVQHSAMYELQLLNKDNKEEQQNPDVIRKQNLQMWSDWYTLLMADTVYHTHSDFSISAIHWMNNHNAHSILGYNTETKQFETQIESWWRDGETIPLVQRTIEGQPGTTNELRACV